MNLLFQLRTFLIDLPSRDPDPLRRAGYYDGEPRPKIRRHWANG